MGNPEVEELKAMLRGKYDKKIIMTGNELKTVEFIPFSSPKAVWVTRGGIAKRRLAEFSGVEGSGKTTSALDILANYQKMDERLALFADLENTLDADWATMLGVDMERVLLIKPEQESAETITQMVLDLIDTGRIGLVIMDSLPYLIPKAVIEGTMDDKSYCGNSGVITQFVGKLGGKLVKQDCTFIMINQVRDKIGSMYVSYNTPGGRAFKHACSQRIMFHKGRFLDANYKEVTGQEAEPKGNIIDIKVEKNKVSKFDRRLTSMTLMYHEGIGVLNDTLDLAIMNGVIEQGGKWYYVRQISPEGEIVGEIKYDGKAKLITALKEDEELFEYVKSKVFEKLY